MICGLKRKIVKTDYIESAQSINDQNQQNTNQIGVQIKASLR
jgi:hypothetical protein